MPSLGSRPPRLIPLGGLGPCSSIVRDGRDGINAHPRARARALTLEREGENKSKGERMNRRERERKEGSRVSSRYTATAVSHGGSQRGGWR